MKKKLAILLTTVLVFGMTLTGCGNDGGAAAPADDGQKVEEDAGDAKDEGDAGDTEQPADIEEENEGTSEASELKVAFITPQATGDNGPVDDIMLAVDRVKNDYGIEVQVVEALDTTDQEDAVRSFATEGYDVIFTLFQQFVEPVRKIAPDYPDTKFVMIYATDDLSMDNVVAYAYDAWETSYAAGVLAASMSESGILGNVVGYEDDTIIANSNAFLAGAQTVNPNATVKRINAASFEDPAKGKEVGNQLIADGADVIFTDAARTSLGVIEAAQEASGDVFIIGDNADHSALAPSAVIGDNIYGYGNTLYNQISDIVAGKFESGVIVCSVGNGISVLQTYDNFGSDGASDELKSKYTAAVEATNAVIEQIKNGEVTVEKDTSVK